MSADNLQAILQRYDEATTDSERRALMAEFVAELQTVTTLCVSCGVAIPAMSINLLCVPCALRTASTAPEEVLP